MQRLPGEDGVGEAAERVRVADEGGRARHAGEGSSLGVRAFTLEKVFTITEKAPTRALS